jgi:hypothetical protein
MLNKVGARFFCNVITRHAVVASENDLRALFYQSVDRSLADTIGAASDEGYLALKSFCHGLSPQQDWSFL